MVIWLDERGKAGLFGDKDQLRPEVASLLNAGFEVVGADLLYQGEFLLNQDRLRRSPRVKNPRESAAYTYGYNLPVFAQRVRDLRLLISYARDPRNGQGWVGVVAPGSVGPIAAAVRAVAPGMAQAYVIGSPEFRFLEVGDVQDPDFQPAVARYGDLPGLVALGSPTPLRIVGPFSGGPREWPRLPDLRTAVEWLKEEVR
jgi:hypothetical protein